MTDDGYGTIRAPEDAIEDAREQKEAAGRTWGEQIVRPDGDRDNTTTNTGEDVTTVLQAIGSVEERVGRIERTLEELTR